MTEPLGTEFIRILPDLTGFRAAVQEQVAAALTGIGAQVRSEIARLTPAVGAATPAAVPEPARAAPTVTTATATRITAAAEAQDRLAAATLATNEQLLILSTRTRTASEGLQQLRRDMQTTATASERLSRGAAVPRLAVVPQPEQHVILPRGVEPTVPAPVAPPAAIETTRTLTTETRKAAEAQAELATATQATDRAVRRIELPAGIRSISTGAEAAARAEKSLEAAATSARAAVAGIVLPPGFATIAAAADTAASAEGRLAAAADAAKTATTTQAATPTGIILPTERRVRAPEVVGPPTAAADATRALTNENNAAAASEEKLATSSKATNEQLRILSTTNRTNVAATRNLRREIEQAETATGRFTRGTLAATAASTGFFRAVSFASGAFLIGAGIGATIGAAVDEFKNATVVAAQTAAVLRATGGAANVTAQQVDKLAKSTLNLTGIDDEQVKSAANVLLTFRAIRNEVGAGNDIFNRAVRAVTDISSVFRTDLTGSAVQLGKALQDPVRGVTALRRSGITLSQSQRDLIKSLVDTGRLLEAQRVILGEVEHQVGGTAQAIGTTLPGRLAIFRETAKNTLGEYVKRITESQQATRLATQAAQALGQAFAVLRGIVQTVGPPLLVTVEALGKATQAVGGVGTILAVVAAYKAVKIAIGIATAAQALYTRSVLVGTGAITAEEAALLASAGAFRAQSAAALLGSEVKVGSQLVRIGEVGAAGKAAATGLREVEAAGAGAATAVTSVGRAGGAAAAGTGLLRTALAAIGGETGALAIGLGAIAGGFFLLNKRANEGVGTLHAFEGAINDAERAFEQARGLRGLLTTQTEKVSVAQFDVTAAQRALAQARAAQARSTAPVGSLQQQGLAARVALAQQTLTRAENALRTAQQGRQSTVDKLNAADQKRPAIISHTTEQILRQIRALAIPEAPAAVDVVASRLEQQGIARAKAQAAARNIVATQAGQQLERLNGLLAKLGETGGQVDRVVAKALRAIVLSLDRLPTPKEITIAVRLALRGESPGQIATRLLGTGTQTIGGATAEQLRQRGARLSTDENQLIAQNAAAANKALQAEQKKLATLRETLTTRRQDLSLAQNALTTARENVQAAREQAAAARETLTETIQQARQGVTQAVRDAKTNLDSLGQAIADALGQFADKAGQTLGPSGPLSKRFKELRDQILAGQGGPETQRAAQEIQAQIAAQQPAAATDTADKLRRRFADLADSFSRGAITSRQFEARLNSIVKGIDFRAFQRLFGSAATNQLRAEITAFRQQERLIAGGPQRPGGTFQATLVRPLEAVAEGNKQIAAAQKDVTRADQDLARAIRELRGSQIRELRANTNAQKALTKELHEANRVQQAKNALNRPKPQGKAGQDANNGTKAGAGAP